MKTRLIAAIMFITTLSTIFHQQLYSNALFSTFTSHRSDIVNASAAEFSWRVDLPDVTDPARVSLRAESGASLGFKTQNGLTLSGKPPVSKMIPYLVLYRNGELAPETERTFTFEISSLPVPVGGITLTVEIETQHPDPDQGSASRERISLWRQTEYFENLTGFAKPHTRLVITHTFGASVASFKGDIPTPTDYLAFHLTLTDAGHPADDPLYEHVEEFAVLLENQWILPLPGLNESEIGAAPRELILFACDMFPFQHDELDEDSRLSRPAVGEYIQEELLPLIEQAVYEQTNTWGFTWYPEWTSYRKGENAERLSVALTKPGVWFHGKAPGSAHSGISINTRHKDYALYDNLTDAIMGAFHHELFHNLQRNLNQKFGGDGNIDADQDTRAFFTEGTAIMASSVGQTEVEFAGERSYLHQANSFITGDKNQEDHLKTGFEDINPYQAALYWRFLYENCGGNANGAEDQHAGMQVIRNTLESLFELDTREIKEYESLTQVLPIVMDRTLEKTQTCPFDNYRDSLVSFARSIYIQQLGSSDCASGEILNLCGLFDPNDLYKTPPTQEMDYAGMQQAYQGEIPGGYGMEFIDIRVPKTDEPVTVEFTPLSKGSTEFRLQILRYSDEELSDDLVMISPEPLEEGLRQGEPVSLRIPKRAEEVDERLVLIVTRVDGNETNDPKGEYRVRLR